MLDGKGWNAPGTHGDVHRHAHGEVLTQATCSAKTANTRGFCCRWSDQAKGTLHTRSQGLSKHKPEAKAAGDPAAPSMAEGEGDQAGGCVIGKETTGEDVYNHVPHQAPG